MGIDDAMPRKSNGKLRTKHSDVLEAGHGQHGLLIGAELHECVVGLGVENLDALNEAVAGEQIEELGAVHFLVIEVRNEKNALLFFGGLTTGRGGRRLGILRRLRKAMLWRSIPLLERGIHALISQLIILNRLMR